MSCHSFCRKKTTTSFLVKTMSPVEPLQRSGTQQAPPPRQIRDGRLRNLVREKLKAAFDYCRGYKHCRELCYRWVSARKLDVVKLDDLTPPNLTPSGTLATNPTRYIASSKEIGETSSVFDSALCHTDRPQLNIGNSPITRCGL